MSRNVVALSGPRHILKDSAVVVIGVGRHKAGCGTRASLALRHPELDVRRAVGFSARRLTHLGDALASSWWVGYPRDAKRLVAEPGIARAVVAIQKCDDRGVCGPAKQAATKEEST
jgi:hypothetical protein